jgi:hypothetical protein
LKCSEGTRRLDIERVRAGLRLIAERGYDGGEPLAQKLDTLLSGLRQ